MGDAARRLGEARGLGLARALAVVSEAVWWVMMVDATVVRYHPDAYNRVLAGLDPAGRRKAEGTPGGLRVGEVRGRSRGSGCRRRGDGRLPVNVGEGMARRTLTIGVLVDVVMACGALACCPSACLPFRAACGWLR